MKFLVDVCAASRPRLTTLAKLGHDVLSAQDHCLHASDEALRTLAREQGRVLITEDKDFGELVFVRGMAHPGIVRLVEMTPMEKAQAMQSVIERHVEVMRDGAIVVVTRTRVRIRPASNVERDEE